MKRAPPRCLVLALSHAAVDVYMLPHVHTLFACKYTVYVITTLGSDKHLYATPCFQFYHNTCLSIEGREYSERAGREKKKKRVLCCWHTALSSVTSLLKSAGPPFSQCWIRAKKPLVCSTIASKAQVSFMVINAKCRNSILQTGKWLSLQRKCREVFIYTKCTFKLQKPRRKESKKREQHRSRRQEGRCAT